MDKLNQRISEIDGQLDSILQSAKSAGSFTDAQREQVTKLEGERDSLEKQIGDIAVLEKKAAERAAAKVAADAEATRIRLEEERKRRTEGGNRITSSDTSTPAKREHVDELGRVVGSIEGTDEEITLRFGEGREAVQRQSFVKQNRINRNFLKSKGYQPWGEFKSFGDFARAGLAGHQRQDFRDRVDKHYAAVQGMSEGVGSDGGFLVMPEFAPGILDRVYRNDLWSRTDNYTVTGNSMTFIANAETSRATGSRHGGLRGYWLGEGATKTASKPTFREITLKLAKLAVVVYLTDELLEDTGNVLNEYVARKAAEEFNFMIGDSLINGTGVGQPLGLLNWPSLVSVAKEQGQLADTLETENIIKMFSRFYGPNRGNMVWLHNQDIEPELFTMTLGVGTGGVVTYMPPGGLSSAPYATLMGRPMIPTEFNPTLGDQGDIIAADLGQMLSISKGGIAQAVSIHVEFLTDQTALRFVMRLNAGPWETAPLTPYKGAANTTSNAVTLDAR